VPLDSGTESNTNSPLEFVAFDAEEEAVRKSTRAPATGAPPVLRTTPWTRTGGPARVAKGADRTKHTTADAGKRWCATDGRGLTGPNREAGVRRPNREQGAEDPSQKEKGTTRGQNVARRGGDEKGKRGLDR
jgi:hypothetical protein